MRRNSDTDSAALAPAGGPAATAQRGYAPRRPERQQESSAATASGDGRGVLGDLTREHCADFRWAWAQQEPLRWRRGAVNVNPFQTLLAVI